MINIELLKKEWLKIETRKELNVTAYYKIIITLKSGYEFMWGKVESDDIIKPKEINAVEIYEQEYKQDYNNAENIIEKAGVTRPQYRGYSFKSAVSDVNRICFAHKNGSAEHLFYTIHDLSLLDGLCDKIIAIKEDVETREQQYKNEYARWEKQIAESLEINKTKKLAELYTLLDIK